MFRISSSRRALPLSVAEADKAEGFIFSCKQAALDFGHNRKTPVLSRPVVLVRREIAWALALPCTSQGNSENPKLFELTEPEVMWSKKRSPDQKSFASCRYEILPNAELQKKIGLMSQEGRIRLLNWLKSRF